MAKKKKERLGLALTDTPKTPDSVQQAAVAAAAGQTLEAATPAKQSSAGVAHKQTQPLEQQLDDLYNQYVDREPFAYDPENDALYQQYREQYLTQGYDAMLDAMGQAAHLTGGYGSTYAQGAGQQAYGKYLQQLGAVMPELYQQAWEQYQAQGQDMLNQYEILQQQQQQEQQQQAADREYEQQQAQQEYDRQQDAYAQLIVLISAGYRPTAEELEEAGMTEEQANTLLNYYGYYFDEGGNDGDDGGGGGSGISSYSISLIQAALGISADGIWGSESSGAAGGLTAAQAWDRMQNGVWGTGRAQAFFKEKGSRETWRARGVGDESYDAMVRQWLADCDFLPAEIRWLEQQFSK